MLVNAIIKILNFIIGIFISLLPDIPFPAPLEGVLDVMVDTAHAFDLLFPMTELLLVVGVFVLVEGSILGFRTGEWIYNKLRGAG